MENYEKPILYVPKDENQLLESLLQVININQKKNKNTVVIVPEILSSYKIENVIRKNTLLSVALINSQLSIGELLDYYNEIKNDYKTKEKEDAKEDIYSVFEKEFGRTLSSMDCEIINAWIENGFSEELILSALKEAVYNGATSLRYIDKVLYEWNRKGIKAPDDVKKMMEKEPEAPLYETSVMNYNWLNGFNEK